MRRRALIAAAPAAATFAVLPLAEGAAAAERFRYRRRRRYPTGLLLEDVTGEASFGRRRGDFEGDCLITGLHHGRKLHAAGFLSGEADLEGRRLDFEIDVHERFRRVALDLSERRGRVSTDLAEIEAGRLDVDLDAVKLDDIRGPFGRQLERLLEKLAEALEDEDGWRKRGRRDDDVEALVEAINDILAKTLHVVDAGRRHDRRAA